MKPTFFVSGIGTEIGKTVISAVLVEALEAQYWKPVQSGDLDNSDSHKIAEWTSLASNDIFSETYRLNQPMSPHAAAAIDGITIELDNFKLPVSNKPLIVEGAGGLMVPLNDQYCIIDLIKHLAIPVILVSRIYLGNINHTLLSVEALRNREIPIAGIVFNGPENPGTTSIIEKYTNLPILFHLEDLGEVNSQSIHNAAGRLRPQLNQKLLIPGSH